MTPFSRELSHHTNSSIHNGSTFLSVGVNVMNFVSLSHYLSCLFQPILGFYVE